MLNVNVIFQIYEVVGTRTYYCNVIYHVYTYTRAINSLTCFVALIKARYWIRFRLRQCVCEIFNDDFSEQYIVHYILYIRH